MLLTSFFAKICVIRVDENEVAILRAAGVIDQHLKLNKPVQRQTQFGFLQRRGDDDDVDNGFGEGRSLMDFEAAAGGSFGLFGYQIEPSRDNEHYSTDYFYNSIDGGAQPSKEIDD